MAWFVLVFAGLAEVVWAAALHRSEGLTRPGPTALTAVMLFVSVGLLGVALRELPLGTAYAVWVGIGTVGTVVFGIVWLGEPATAVRLACLGLIAAGIVGLKATHVAVP